MLTYKYITNFETFNVIFTLICNILCVFLCFKSTFRSAFFHGMCLGIIQFISEVVSVYLTSEILSVPSNSYTSDMTFYSINVILSKLFYFSICRLLLRFSIKENSKNSWGRWFALSVLPISSIFIILVVRTITAEMAFSTNESILCITSISVLLIANIVIYIIYEKAEKSSQKLIELELANQKNEINMQHLELLEMKNEKMNIMAHDYKNHLLTIDNICGSEEVHKYIDKMLGDISRHTAIAKTQNKWLDIILNKYVDMCNDKNIDFEINVSTDNLSFINSYDMSSLFNNILDNAYEAALSSSQKYIHLDISKALYSYHRIIVKNSSDNPPQIQNGKLISTKSNKELHGYGTKSIEKVVTKYHGELQWNYDEQFKEFKLIILFPNYCEF